MKLCENVCHHLIMAKFETKSIGSKTKALGQILEESCIHSKEHSFDPNFMKLCLNVYLHEI